MACETLEDQHDFFHKRWDSWRWRALFRVFFSRAVMARRGRSRAQFAHVEGSVSASFLERTEHVMTALPISDNPFLQWILTGELVDPELGQPYFSEDGHRKLRAAADRIRFVHEDLIAHFERSPPGAYSAFNLSDVPEYLSESETEALLRAAVGCARSGARLAYWNLLVPRCRPESMADLLERDTVLGARLIREDRAFVYGAFQVETVR